MNQMYYYLIKGMVRGRITLDRTSKVANTYRPYLEYTFILRKDGVKIGEYWGSSADIPVMKLYGIFLDLRPLLKVQKKLEEIADNKANKVFMKDLMASLTKTVTYRNE